MFLGHFPFSFAGRKFWNPTGFYGIMVPCRFMGISPGHILHQKKESEEKRT